MSTAVANADLVRELYRAFADRDFSSLDELIAEDAVWHVPGRNPLAGTHRGRLAILSYFAGLGKRAGESFRIQVIDVLASERRAVAIARSSGQRGAKVYDGMFCLLVAIEAGQIREAWLMPADAFALDDFLT
jgi:uncharacterized protein